MVRLVIVALLGLPFFTDAQSLSRAEELYYQLKATEAYAAFEKVAASQNEQDAIDAHLRLSRMDWLLYMNDQKATSRLTSLIQEYPASSDRVYAVWARMLTDQKKYDESIEKARQSMANPSSASAAYHSQVVYLKSVLRKYLDKSGELTESSKDFSEAYTMIDTLIDRSPGDIGLSGIALGYYLLNGNGPKALSAWRSYYRISDTTAYTMLRESGQLLLEGLQSWNSGKPDENKPLSVIKGLAGSGFFEYANKVAQSAHPALIVDSYIKDLRAYLDFLDAVNKLTTDFYRLTVVKKQKEKKYKSALIKEAETLLNNLTWEKSPPAFSLSVFEQEISKRFRAQYRLSEANGYFGLSYGHLVIDEARSIHQYGKSGELRFLVLDHMLSNGYSSWFWDGRAEIGGWAAGPNAILQIRSAYSNGPVRAWIDATDEAEIFRKAEKQKELNRLDDSLAHINSLSYLPGLANRIVAKARNKILDSLKLKKSGVHDLRLAFIQAYESQLIESSIFAHEGRHTIDLKDNPKMKAEELEYRAKLSEIYFAPNPFLALNAVYSRNMNDGTPHGQANYRIMRDILKWMEANKNKIQSYDETKPLLPQLDKLTEQQLKQAVNAVDPLAVSSEH
ncbi:MAG: hypothetical protein KIT62_01415 [Cyclobacteriaceae bacterium]|nr:hypothetical protein [Cyclobacteriaceae bacterium]